MTDVVVAEDTTTVVVPITETVVIAAGAQGPRGRDGIDGTGALQFMFGWGDATPALLTAVTAGKAVLTASVYVTEAFDGAGAAVTVGDALVHDRLVSAADIDLTSIGGSELVSGHVYDSTTNINLYITPGAGATQGAGIVTLVLQQ